VFKVVSFGKVEVFTGRDLLSVREGVDELR